MFVLELYTRRVMAVLMSILVRVANFTAFLYFVLSCAYIASEDYGLESIGCKHLIRYLGTIYK